MRFFLSAFVLGLQIVAPYAQAQYQAFVDPMRARFEWKITKPEWTEEDEHRFGEFVKAIGQTRCRTTDDCLRSAANPWRDTDPAPHSDPEVNRRRPLFNSDCADFPYILRAYFAAKNGLPFGYANRVVPNDPSTERGRNLRYNPAGNHVGGRLNLLPTGAVRGSRVESITYPNLYVALRTMTRSISSAMFRIDVAHDDNVRLFSDTYPVPIDRQHVRPGTTIYDPAGHVAIVYDVDDDGVVRYMDGHPGNSVTRGVYNGDRFNLGRPSMGGGLKNFRPLRLQNYVRVNERNEIDPAGRFYVNGHLSAPTNDELTRIGAMSLVQYFGTEGASDWRQRRYRFGGRDMEDYWDYVRNSLFNGTLHYVPVNEFKEALIQLCTDVRDRIDSVDAAVRDNIHTRAHPDRLPENIYGTEGDWETYSTPSRDARLKSSLRGLRQTLERWIRLERARDPRIVYRGDNLSRDLMAQFYIMNDRCQLEYRKSDGTMQQLRLTDIIDRAFLMSFDPYHCPELRWGATGAELASCQDDRNKRDWYAAEQMLRNQLERNYDASMAMTLAELRRHRPGTGGVGVGRAPDVDFEAYLLGLNNGR